MSEFLLLTLLKTRCEQRSVNILEYFLAFDVRTSEKWSKS